MRITPLIRIFCIGLFFFFSPKIAFGLAGWSESNYEYYFTPEIVINFGNPSDMCPSNHDHQTCFNIYYLDDYSRSKGFKNLDLLSEVGVPTSLNPQFIIGLSYSDSDWLIYDINKDAILFKDSNYNTILSKWSELGNSEPVLVNTKNFFKNFKKETKESKEMNKTRDEFTTSILLTVFFLLGIPFAILVAIIVSTIKK